MNNNDRANGRAPHQTIDSGVQISRLGKVIANNRNKFYDPISRKMLPPFAEFIHLMQLIIEDFGENSVDNAVSQLPSPTIEGAIISHFADEEVRKIMHSLFSENLNKERQHAISQDQYIKNTQKRMNKLKGRIFLVEPSHCVQAYACISFLYELRACTLRPMLSQFTGGINQRNSDSVYQSVSGITILQELTQFARLLHRFAHLEWIPEVVDILTQHEKQLALDEYKLRTAVHRTSQIVDDNILVYIIQHIKRDVSETIPINVFDDDIFEKYFAHLQENVSFIANRHKEIARKETIRKIRINLFDHLPEAELAFYTRKNNKLLEKQRIYYFAYAELIEIIVLFIDHIFHKMVTNELQMPLLLKAVWNDVKAQKYLTQLFTDLKDLRARIATIDREIISLIGHEKLFNRILNNVNLVEGIRKEELFDKFTIIDSRFVETVHIFRGIAKQIATQFHKLRKDRVVAKKSMIRNWVEVNRFCTGIDYRLLKAISAFRDCIDLVDAIYKHAAAK